MSRITFYGYFGPSQNVKDAPLSPADVETFAAAIAALPQTGGGAIGELVVRGADGRPMRFIPASALPGGSGK